MWFLYTLEPDSPYYNIPAAVRLQGPLDLVALEKALNYIVQRHEVLRAHFPIGPDGPLQEIVNDLYLPLPMTDASDIVKDEQKQLLAEFLQLEVSTPFNIEQDAVLRAKLLRLGSQEHILLFTIHHIAFDEWSTTVFVKELGTLYDAFRMGKSPDLPSLPIQYADFAWWQRQQLSGERLQSQLDYWRQQLEGAPSLLELPTDRPRPPVQTYNGATYILKIPAAIRDALQAIADEAGASLFMVLLAAYQVLLFHYTGQEDIVVGAPIANRVNIELEALIGYFVNTLAIRSKLVAESGFRQVVRQVKQTALEAYEHQDVPFEMLVDEIQPLRNLSYTPVFQTVFSLQRNPLRGFLLGDLRLSLLENSDVTAKFDLSLIIEEEEEDLTSIFEYNVDLFDAATIERMARHWRHLLESITAAPEQPIADLTLLPPDEYDLVVNRWNRTASFYPRQRAVSALFEEQVTEHPQRPAMRLEDEIISYGELNRRANRVAHYLRSLGVRPGELIGLSMERSFDVVVATLAILKAGCAYLPLDADYPPERLRFMLSDAQTRIILVDESNRFKLDSLLSDQKNDEILRITLNDSAIVGQPVDNLPAVEGGDNPAYVMYTSGSTGRPKGVVIPHRGIVRLVKNANYMDFSPEHVFLLLAPISFDAATLEIWGPLLNGGLLAVMPPGTPSLSELGEKLREYGVTTLWLTAGLFHRMVEERLSDLLGVERLLSGGDVLSVSHVRQVLDAKKPGVVINGYGPTENTTFSTCYPINHPEQVSHFVSIGRPIANSQVYILNACMKPVPIGVVGEIYLGGDGLALGYLNRPELTAERFVPNPFSQDPNARLYKTGDLGRYLSDGGIDFKGRRDFQVKVRGFRIELGEIETVLGQHPAVQNAVVVARSDDGDEKRLVAYLIFVPAADPPSAADIRAYLSELLPDYAIPAVFVFLDAFPLNPNGKVDRKALPPPDFVGSVDERIYVEPRTPLERHLAKRFSEILGIDRIGVLDNFFETGGDSLRGAVLINRLQDDFHVKAPVRAIFLAPTVEKMAAYLQEYYPEALRQIIQKEVSDQEKTSYAFESEIVRPGQQVDDAAVKQFRSIISHLPPRLEDGQLPKNPPATFILSPPRSGSTLLRVMLAGNPELFAPPELDLLSFNTLGQRKAAFQGRYEFWLEGLLRAVMELRGVDAEDARALIDKFERQNMPVKAFYGLMQSWLGDRMLVDKTPVYSLDPAILQRMERDFENARYIHLIRHPYATIYSFIEAKLDTLFFRWEHPFSRRELAELIWLASHRNILDFLARIPHERHVVVQYEDLLTDPEGQMRRISNFLGVDYVPAMVDPYSEDRMTTGLQPGKQMVGDYKFYLRKKIDPAAATRWKRFHRHDFLSDLARSLARDLGYQDFTADQGAAVSPERRALTIHPGPRDGDLPLSFSQQRLWFLDHLEPGTPLYNIPAAVRLEGRLDVPALEAAVNDVIARHENLRTTFHTVDGKPKQIIHPKMPISIRLEDLCDLPSDMREQEARRRAQQFAQQSFDLARGPLLRVALYQVEPDVHLAVIVLHHIVSDGWSNNILIQELALYYDAYLNAHSPQLPPLPIQYADYAAWQRRWLQTEDATQQLDYWREQLSGHPTYLVLPTDYSRPPVQTYHGAQIRFDLPSDLVAALDELAQKHHATLFMALMAGFQTLLYRYTRQESINVGIPIANRNLSEVEELIGFFVNTLVLRADFSKENTFAELVEQVQNTAVNAYTNQAAPFELVVDAVQPERDPSYSPLFQVMFAYQEDPPHGIAFSNFKLTPISLDVGIAKFDMTLSAVKRADQIRAVLEYNTDLFEDATIRRFIGHYQALLKQVLANPHRQVNEIDILTPEERRKILVEWNATGRENVASGTIPQMFLRQAAATPDAPAVVFENSVLSFAELDARSNQFAHALIARGVGPESLVGLMLSRSAEMLIALLGILKAGGAYVPLDPSYPAERLRYMIEDAGLKIVISNQLSVISEISDDGQPLTVHCLLTTDDSIATFPAAPPSITLHPDNAAYVIYTSGSTGLPKGVVIPHRNALNLAAGLKRQIYDNVAPNRTLRISLNAPLAFDASVQQWIMLIYGHTLVIVPDEVRRDGAALVDFIRAQNLDLVDCVPTQLKLMIEHGLLDGASWKPLAMLPGGEAIDQTTWNELRAQESIQFFNMYGPTECTVDSMVSWVNRSGVRPNIGRFLNNDRGYVLDAYGQPVPLGVPGELYLGGVGVARGYLSRPALTAERFVPDLFLDLDAEKTDLHSSEGENKKNGANLLNQRQLRLHRLYRTGDLVRWLPSGELEFLGRVDFQVKLHGYRIELGEIEAVLREHESIKDVVVMVREDMPGVQRLAAYLIPDTETRVGISELRKFVSQRVPEYMIPGVFVYLDAFPLLPNGKINRRALPEPEINREDLGEVYASPRTSAEKVLVQIWSELLRLDLVGVDDNFFEMGGDSILAIQMISRAADAGLIITAKQLFQYPTIAGLAAVADEGERVDAEQGIVTGPAPLTPIQHWFFEQTFPHPNYWNQAILLESGQPLDANLMRQAVTALLAHHDALRMRFARDENGHWVQENAGFEEGDDEKSRASEHFKTIDLASTADDALADAITEHCSRVQGKLSLANGPLFRAVYFDLGHNRGWRLLLVAHHLVIDGVSWRILTEDLGRAYLSLLGGKAIRLSRKTTAFRDWARALLASAQAGDFDAEATFWQKMAASSAPELPVDFAASPEANLESTLALVQTHLDVVTTQKLLVSVESDVQTMLLAALARTLTDWTDSDRVLLAMENHGR
ncbi:MAG: hypothetical protein DSY55_02140, partial [Clostridia bacterium]